MLLVMLITLLPESVDSVVVVVVVPMQDPILDEVVVVQLSSDIVRAYTQ